MALYSGNIWPNVGIACVYTDRYTVKIESISSISKSVNCVTGEEGVVYKCRFILKRKYTYFYINYINLLQIFRVLYVLIILECITVLYNYMPFCYKKAYEFFCNFFRHKRHTVHMYVFS